MGCNTLSYGRIELILACIFYAIQIYADFAGYMDIALGASEIMGIRLSENFKAPYFSASVPEFWRRWHITLGSWFRDYLFYPVMRSGWCSKLGKFIKEKFGKKLSGKVTTVIALMCVWFFTGMWHGASWHYIIWGVYYGILIILSTLLAPVFDGFVQKHSIDRSKPLYKSVQILKTFALVCLGYIFFRSTGMTQAFGIIGRIFSVSAPLNSPAGIGLDKADLLVALIAVAVLIITDIYRAKEVDIREAVGGKAARTAMGGIFYIVVFGYNIRSIRSRIFLLIIYLLSVLRRTIMNIKLQRIIKAAAFMLIFCLLFSGATYILRNKNEANIVLPFYDEPKNTLDVIFTAPATLCAPSIRWSCTTDTVLPRTYLQAPRSFCRNPTISLRKRCATRPRK